MELPLGPMEEYPERAGVAGIPMVAARAARTRRRMAGLQTAGMAAAVAEVTDAERISYLRLNTGVTFPKAAYLTINEDLPLAARRVYARIVQNDWKDRIVSDPTVLRGKPCIKGTRIPVPLILGYLAAGRPAQEITAEFPGLSADDVAACLRYARDLADFEIAPGA